MMDQIAMLDGQKMTQTASSMTVLHMPKWKHRVLNGVAWLLGMRGEHVACITFNFDYTDVEKVRERLEDGKTNEDNN